MSAVSISHRHARPSDGGRWRWQARRLLAELRDLLVTEAPAYDGWLAARGQGLARERHALLTRVAVLASRAVHEHDAEALRAEVTRLVVDVDHHLQRRRDLAWDEVELELGGSE